MQMVHIREAVIEDLPNLLMIYNHAVRTSAATFDLEEWTLEERREWFSHYGGPYPLIVAVVDGVVVGYSSLSPFRQKAAYAKTVEISVYIDPKFWGRGIGKILMEEILKRAKELQYHIVISGITAGNDASVKLHEKFGFSYIGTFHEVGWKFNKWQDVMFYELILPESSS